MVTDRIIAVIISVQTKWLNTSAILLIEGGEKLLSKVKVSYEIIIFDVEQSD